jgi:hypothetical protein
VRLALVLAGGGSMVLMAGFSLVVIGEAMGLQHPGRAGGLITLGLVLAVTGLATGLGCAAVTLASRQVRASPAGGPVAAAQVAAVRAGPPGEAAAQEAAGREAAGRDVAGRDVAGQETAGHETTVPAMTAAGTVMPGTALPAMAQTGPELPARQPAGARRAAEPVADEPPADDADEWLNPFRGAGVRPVSSAVRDRAAARPHAEPAAYPEFPPQYSDAGWQLDSPDLTPAGPPGAVPLTAGPRLTASPPPSAGPPPAGGLPLTAGPPPEIHHPVRSQHPAHTTGQFPAYQTGQFPAYRDPAPGEPDASR